MTIEQEQMAITKYDLYYESRLTKLETISQQLTDTIREIKQDLRWVFGITLGFYAITLSLVAKCLHIFGS